MKIKEKPGASPPVAGSPAQEAAAAEKSERGRIMAGYLRLVLRLGLLALVGTVLFTKVFLVTQASGNEMFPAVKDGDLLIAFRLQRDYAKDDVVLYTCGEEKAVGRIAALEGDVVTLDTGGTLFVNGTPQDWEGLFPACAEDVMTYPYRVPPGAAFILGDHRSSVRDSRDSGAIPMQDVEGKVITLLRRRGI